MHEVMRKRVIVEAGGEVRLEQTGLPEGAVAELVVLVDEKPARPNYRSFFGSGKGLYSTPEEVTEFIRRERDSWEE